MRRYSVLRQTRICSLVSLLVYAAHMLLLSGGTLSFGSNEAVGKPIWAAGEPRSGQVALFRHRFHLTDSISSAYLDIFADTRYEAWVDGRWAGRGPARFSALRQEFDRLPAGNLHPGEHVLAVLVQYAPNHRRSVSLGGGLYAHLSGSRSGGQIQTIAVSSRDWRAIISPAWNIQASQIHGWQLIGPQELLDLHSLPADWMLPAFNDSNWTAAVELPTKRFSHLVPRSIPLLTFAPRSPQAVVETGLLSPDHHILDFDGMADTQPPLSVTLQVEHTMQVQLEATRALSLTIDGNIVSGWQPLHEHRRPDVQYTMHLVEAGDHTLAVQPGPQGTALAITRTGVLVDHPLRQGNNPGRRMLLANPVPGGPSAPTVVLEQHYAQSSIPASASPRYLLLDFGRTLHARPDLIAEGPSGTVIDIGWDERLLEGRALPAAGSLHHNLWNQVDSWVLDGTPRHLTTLDTRAGRYMLLVIWGKGEVRLSNIQAIEETMVHTVSGSFASNDRVLNRIWQVGVDTLIPNMTDAYADPWRERGQWVGDAFAALHTNRVSVGDLGLWRRMLLQVSDDPNPDGSLAPVVPRFGEGFLLDYCMLWLESLYRYWQVTGDTDLLRELLPTAHNLMTFLHQFENESGLLYISPQAYQSQNPGSLLISDPSSTLRIPWTANSWLYHSTTPATTGSADTLISPTWAALIDWRAVSSRTGESMALNALYSANLRWMAEMTAAVGTDGAEKYARRSEALRTAIHQRLYLPNIGAYATSRFDVLSISPSPQAQAWALNYDIVPGPYRTTVTDAMLRQMNEATQATGYPGVEIYGFFWVLNALGKYGRTADALELVRIHYGRLLDQGATTWWEGFSSNQRYDASLSHGWGGSPTWFLSTYILGTSVLPHHEWRVAPQAGDLQHASGSIPLWEDKTLTVTVDWQAQGCVLFDMLILAPQDSQGYVVVPVPPEDAQLLVNGILVWPRFSSNRYPVTRVDAGLQISLAKGESYTVRVISGCPHLFLPQVRR